MISATAPHTAISAASAPVIAQGATAFAQFMPPTVTARAGQRAVELGPTRESTPEARARRRLAEGDSTTHAAALAAAELKLPDQPGPAAPAREPSPAPRGSEPTPPQAQPAGAALPRATTQSVAAGHSPSHAKANPARQPEPAALRPAAQTTPHAHTSGRSGHSVAVSSPRAAAGGVAAPQASAVTRAVAALAKTAERPAAASAKPAAPILRQAPAEEAFAAQLQRGIAAALTGTGGTVTMRLNPEALGSLQVRLDLQGSTVAARFRVESDEARKLLDEHLPALRSALEARGLVVDRVVVDLHHPPGADPQQQPAPLATPTGSTNPDGRREKREQPSRRSPLAASAAPTLGSRSDPYTSRGGALQIRLDAIA